MDKEKQKNNDYPWDSLDTTTLMLPIELITYHLCRFESLSKKGRTNEEKRELQIIKSYIQKENKKEEEVDTCFQK